MARDYEGSVKEIRGEPKLEVSCHDIVGEYSLDTNLLVSGLSHFHGERRLSRGGESIAIQNLDYDPKDLNEIRDRAKGEHDKYYEKLRNLCKRNELIPESFFEG